jgi:hypothetical protein|tara:strand:- start:176 stop:391 length:216 start_codon:yes stop_codon:yes gene_type:complete
MCRAKDTDGLGQGLSFWPLHRVRPGHASLKTETMRIEPQSARNVTLKKAILFVVDEVHIALKESYRETAAS